MQILLEQRLTAGRSQSLTTSYKVDAAALSLTSLVVNGVPGRSCNDEQWEEPCL